MFQRDNENDAMDGLVYFQTTLMSFGWFCLFYIECFGWFSDFASGSHGHCWTFKFGAFQKIDFWEKVHQPVPWSTHGNSWDEIWWCAEKRGMDTRVCRNELILALAPSGSSYHSTQRVGREPWALYGGYPLVTYVNIAIENDHLNSGFTH